MEKPKKILVVGGAGYVGAVLVREMLERGYAVKILDRLFFGTPGIEEIKDKVELVIGDIRNFNPAVLDDVVQIYIQIVFLVSSNIGGILWKSSYTL